MNVEILRHSSMYPGGTKKKKMKCEVFSLFPSHFSMLSQIIILYHLIVNGRVSKIIFRSDDYLKEVHWMRSLLLETLV